MQNRHDLHLLYHGNDQQVVQLNYSKTGLERIFASELTHDIHFCRAIRKAEIVTFEVTIYGKNKREGDFKLIIEPVKSKPTDKKSQTSLHSSFIIEPPCVWAGNKQKGIFRFIVKLENEALLMKMDEDENWFPVLYFSKTLDYYNMRMSLCKTVRSVLIGSQMNKKPSSKTEDIGLKLECLCNSKNSSRN
ncbi:CB1 cannabinoid receptor-interacting protein 1 [Caenorhabditis elegans]|uniref:CB1 cannabinoid receptor-interacting protein 1 n=1 Tax=Caenorhabditis elegans TaxID=6239 RepID=A0A1X7RBS1_CAEEL|nr:CB1 cannabinoid receptor-interacting protein 1 [Caenorhabditis elegans]SMQ44704.1 CB1 cannabinoid receptor-interacting protein 1 [Caenorhabditis elegans]|eukprot:NP_001338852.1 Uncharacterized protein CELE_F10D7.10 [Caenorhabditis elegans]